MTTTLLNIMFACLIVLAIAVVQTGKIRRAVVISAAFSMSASFTYLLLSAPDVALAEAVIGSTLSTIILLVAIKKYQLFTIYYLQRSSRLNDREIDRTRDGLLGIIERCLLEHEMESQVIYTVEDAKTVIGKHTFDLLVEEEEHLTILHGEGNSYIFNEMTDRLLKKQPDRPLAAVDMKREEEP